MKNSGCFTAESLSIVCGICSSVKLDGGIMEILLRDIKERELGILLKV